MTLNQRQIPRAIENREEFQGSSIRSEFTRYPSSGQLPDAEYAKLRVFLAERDDAEIYVVYSYSTPIAWGDKSGDLYVPDVKYSTTTSRHQSLVRKAS